MALRSTQAVIEDHLQLRAAGDLETDLKRNYADQVVLLCKQGVFHGCNQVRQSAHRLGLQLPEAHFEYLSCQIEGEWGFLEWRAESEEICAEDGADSYVVRDGLIIAQTIHYRLVQKNLHRRVCIGSRQAVFFYSGV